MIFEEFEDFVCGGFGDDGGGGGVFGGDDGVAVLVGELCGCDGEVAELVCEFLCLLLVVDLLLDGEVLSV